MIRYKSVTASAERFAVESNARPTELEERDCHPTLLLLPGLQALFFTFTMLWTCPVQKMELIL